MDRGKGDPKEKLEAVGWQLKMTRACWERRGKDEGNQNLSPDSWSADGKAGWVSHWTH